LPAGIPAQVDRTVSERKNLIMTLTISEQRAELADLIQRLSALGRSL